MQAPSEPTNLIEHAVLGVIKLNSIATSTADTIVFTNSNRASSIHSSSLSMSGSCFVSIMEMLKASIAYSIIDYADLQALAMQLNKSDFSKITITPDKVIVSVCCPNDSSGNINVYSVIVIHKTAIFDSDLKEALKRVSINNERASVSTVSALVIRN